MKSGGRFAKETGWGSRFDPHPDPLSGGGSHERRTRIKNEANIRPTTPADIPAITRIYAHAVKHGTATFELEPPDEAEMMRRFEKLRAGNFPYVVAEIDGAVAGYAYAGLFRERPAYRFTVEDSIYIAPDMHRRGIGRALLSA